MRKERRKEGGRRAPAFCHMINKPGRSGTHPPFLPLSLPSSLSGAGFIISTINAFGSRRDTGRMIKRFPASGAVTRPPASPPAHLYCLPTYIRPDLASVSAAAPKE